MKRTLSILIVLLLCLPVFAGCDRVLTPRNPSGCEDPNEHDWQIVSRDTGCWHISVRYVCSKCNAEQFADGEWVVPNHSWTEVTNDGKSTFTCARCNESITYMSEIQEFRYVEALEKYKIGDPGVKHESFNNPAVESEISGAIDAITRAKLELTIEYDTISVSYDATSNMWCVDFWTLDTDDRRQSVYVNGNGLTCYVVYDES